MNALEYPKLVDELNIDINEISGEKYNTTDMIKITFVHGLQVKVENEKKKKINLGDLSECDAKSAALKLKDDLETLKTDGYLKGTDNEDALLMVKSFESGQFII